MYFTPELMANSFANNRHLVGHWNEMWAGRNLAQTLDQIHVNHEFSAGLQTNATSILSQDFWRQTDALVLELRNQETGMELVEDLMRVQTTLDIGKTVNYYNLVGQIADDVSVSIDGQAPYSFDHVAYQVDGDPVPILTAGYGVNWRLQRGMQTVGIDLTRDSQTAKMREYERKVVAHVMDGSPKIVVDGKASQGIRTHRNTKKIDLGASGASINLTSASPAAMLGFLQGTFEPLLTANRIGVIDIMWVSYEVWTNLSKSVYENNVNLGPAYTYMLKNFPRIKEIRPTFALTGNQFLAYVRRRDYISPLVGMTTSVVALPRPMPQSNYNFQIMGALGLQITASGDGLGGVFYGAVLV